jgi:hypothetical protein
MKEYRESLVLHLPLLEAFHVLFDDDKVMQFMYDKNKFHASHWDKDRRTVHFEIPHDNMPSALVKFVGGGKIRATTQQHRKISPNKIEIKNKIRPHVLGAEFIKISPTFHLTRIDNNTTQFDIYCKLYALLIPPLDKMMEGFMLSSSKKNFSWFREALEYQNHLLVESAAY